MRDQRDNSINMTSFSTWSLVVGLCAVVVSGFAAWLDLGSFLLSYLAAYLSWLSIPLGGLAVVLLHELTGRASWGHAIRKVLGAAMATLPLFAALFLPLATALLVESFGSPEGSLLFPWTDEEYMTAEKLSYKTNYLNASFFLLRSAIYFVTWIGLAVLLTRWQRDERPSSGLSAVGLVLYSITVTFAGIDWVMSLDPHWYSSMFGMLVAASFVLPAFAFGIVVLAWHRDTLMPPEAESLQVWNDLGNFLLTFVMIWAYLFFSQYLLIWSGNLPEEIRWYLQRTQGVWEGVIWIVAICYFFLPFVFLLSRRVKRHPDKLLVPAAIVLVTHCLYQYWLVKPAFLHDITGSDASLFAGLYWADVVTFLAIGGLWLSAFGWQLEKRMRALNVVQSEST